ncbi:dephospho-CoA kinase [Moraxella sp. ZJ142]|uniref:dephospho-CoA kinase n=1 Tax=Moraxella marmotae TaxID=3344520 RepID=UPI0035D42F42
MFILGLTGGIGSGKTAASDYFAAQGITVVDADVIAHQLTCAGSPLLNALQAAFGDWVIDEHGNYNRPAMRQYVFDNPTKLATLNAIMHPAIHHAITNALAQAASAYVVLSVPLLFEGRHKSPNLLGLCHQVLVVDASVDTQLERAAHRDNSSCEQIAAIIDKQISRADRLAIAAQIGADIVNNDGDKDALYVKLAALHAKYLSQAADFGKEQIDK